MKPFLPFVFLTFWNGLAAARDIHSDVCIFGATSAGIAAALQSVRMGKSVSLIEPSNHVGGLTTGGLGATDIGNKAAIGGIAREFYERVFKFYESPDAWHLEERAAYLKAHRGGPDPLAAATGRETLWFFEPHAASAIFTSSSAAAEVFWEGHLCLHFDDGLFDHAGLGTGHSRTKNQREYCNRFHGVLLFVMDSMPIDTDTFANI